MLANQVRKVRAEAESNKRTRHSGGSSMLFAEHMRDPVSVWVLFNVVLNRYIFWPCVLVYFWSSAFLFRVKAILPRKETKYPEETKSFWTKWAIFNLTRQALPQIAALLFWLILKKNPWIVWNASSFLNCELYKQPWARFWYGRLLLFHTRSLTKAKFEHPKSIVFFEKVLRDLEKSMEYKAPHGADVEVQNLICTTCRCEPDQKGQALLLAAKENKRGLSGLLRGGADPNVVDEYGLTPLHHAVRNNNLKNAEALLTSGARTDVFTYTGYSPLAMAAWQGRTTMVRLLAAHGSELDATCSMPQTIPLISAATNNHEGALRALLDSGADPNAVDLWDQTALMVASTKGNLSVLKLLLESGSHIDQQDCFGETALFNASEMGHLAIIQELLNHGANSDLRDIHGRSAMDVAVDEGTRNLLRISTPKKTIQAG